MKDLLPDFSGLKILVVGDVMIDRYLSGTVDRISPEAPVPVIRLTQEDNRLGGAANVLLNLKALGTTPFAASVIGADANGQLLRELLQQHQLSDRGVSNSEERQTTVKTRVIAQHQQLLRADREDTNSLIGIEVEKLINQVEKILDEEKINLIILQDYNKGVLTPATIAAILSLAQRFSIPTAVDPKNKHFWAYRGVELFKPNLREIQAQVDFKITPTLADLDRATAIIREKLDNRWTMITLAEHGVYVHDGQSSEILPTQERKIRDVSGAGDSVISVAGAGLAMGMSRSQIARLANLSGGQVIEKPGVVAVDLAQLKREYEAG